MNWLAVPAYGPKSILSPPDRVAALIAWLPVVRVGNLVKDRRPPISAFTRVFDALWAAALRAVLDKIANTNRNAVQAIKAAFWAFLV
jgi:uncharacterized phage protein gp47/JayE